MRNTEINRQGVSPSGEIRTEITFTDSWGDELEVVFNPKLRRVYINSNIDVQSVSLDEKQMMVLVTETARFYSEGK
ncbi:hypothetical protein vBPFY1MI_143 [Pseudomonas phage vB_PF_Y1-MI]|nr:hypothetical protein vBPFY1MI_143 [Pseudomonas phage vB_PF_Y1-MI]